jgi:hypothetical protein
MSPKEGIPIEGNPSKSYQRWRLYASGERCELLVEGNTREELKFRRRTSYRIAVYYKGNRLEQKRPPPQYNRVSMKWHDLQKPPLVSRRGSSVGSQSLKIAL